MSYIFKNQNPYNNLVGDCVIRAISLANEVPIYYFKKEA